jgi:hypothetical protein
VLSTGFGVSSSGGGGGNKSPSAKEAKPQALASTNAEPTIIKYLRVLFTETIESLPRGWNSNTKCHLNTWAMFTSLLISLTTIRCDFKDANHPKT